MCTYVGEETEEEREEQCEGETDNGNLYALLFRMHFTALQWHTDTHSQLQLQRVYEYISL